MDLEHNFTVQASVEETWAALNDPEQVAPCFPGATLIGVQGDEFNGSAKIRLGPIALQYNGVGTYVERDESGRRVVIEARGKDKRGNGTANATITAQLSAGVGGTAVHVATDLAITGKPAQFGRGVMQDVSDKLLWQFVACLQTKLGAPEATHVPAADGQLAQVEGQAAALADTGAAEATPSGAATGGPVAPRTQAPAYREAPHSAPTAEVELNLLTTIGPVLVRRYATPVLGIVALIAGYLLGRRARR